MRLVGVPFHIFRAAINELAPIVRTQLVSYGCDGFSTVTKYRNSFLAFVRVVARLVLIVCYFFCWLFLFAEIVQF